MLYIANAFSLNMIPSSDSPQHLVVIEVDTQVAKKYIEERTQQVKSIIGHEPTATLVSSILGQIVEFNRESVQITYEDSLIVAQYSGPRLEEGVTMLPEGANIKFFLVYLA